MFTLLPKGLEMLYKYITSVVELGTCYVNICIIYYIIRYCTLFPNIVFCLLALFHIILLTVC